MMKYVKDKISQQDLLLWYIWNKTNTRQVKESSSKIKYEIEDDKIIITEIP